MTLEQSQPLKAPTTDQEWNELFKNLATHVPLSSSHEVAVKYETHFKDWRRPKNADEMEELELLRDHFIDAARQLEVGIRTHAKKIGELHLLPDLTAYIARPDYYRVREVGKEKEYALLGELRDKNGHSVILCDERISSPNPHSYGIIIKRPIGDEKVLFEYQAIYSLQSFTSELSTIEKALVKDGMHALTKLVVNPLLAQVANRASQEFALHGVNRVQLSRIERIPHPMRNEAIFLVHTDRGMCSVKLMLLDGMLSPKAHAKLVR